MLLVFSTQQLANRSITATLGAPGIPALKRALLAAMLNPQSCAGEPGRPARLMVPYRWVRVACCTAGLGCVVLPEVERVKDPLHMPILCACVPRQAQ